MNNKLPLNDRIKNILKNLQNGLASMQVLLIEIKGQDYKNFSERTMQKISDNIGLRVFYKKDKIKAFTKFCLQYKTFDNYEYTRNEWLEFNIFNYEELKTELIKYIDYRIKYIEFTKNTIKKQKTIINKINTVIELKKDLGYENFNIEIVDLLVNNTKDSYYFKR